MQSNIKPYDKHIQYCVDTAAILPFDAKGLLAIDESITICNKRLQEYGVAATVENRNAYRAWIITAPGLADYISGVILNEETLDQCDENGVLLTDIISDAGILVGIKVDSGATALASFGTKQITEGLDGLRLRLAHYKTKGLRFAKWRSVISISTNTPTDTCIEANAHVLARYAALYQEAGIMPVIEPEVIMSGDHSIEKCAEITERLLSAVFNQLYHHRVVCEGIILKPNMVLAGSDARRSDTISEVATATVRCLLRCVPPSVPGVAFLSGGQSSEEATATGLAD